MSFFAALDTSASGMLAQSRATSITSTNIANLTTTGYKRSDSVFYDLVTTSRYSAGYEPGGVTANRVLRANQQGAIQQTGSSTEASISGNGFFVVARNPNETADDSTAPGNLFYTRNGQFGETVVNDTTAGTQTTYLANSAGMFLYGWPFDASTGTVTVDQTSLSELVPVNLSAFQTTAIPTTSLQFAVNLDADETDIDLHRVSGGAQQLPASSQAADFTRNFTVYDTDGAPQELSFEYRKIVGPMAHFTSSVPTTLTISDAFLPTGGGNIFSGLSNGDQFSVDVDGVVETYTFVDEATGDDASLNQIATVQGYIDALEDHGVDPLATPPVTTGLLSIGLNDGQLLARANDPTATITLAEVTGTPLQGASTLNVIGDPDDPLVLNDLVFEPDEDITAPTVYPDQGDFPTITNTTDPVPENWWEITIVNPATGAQVRQGLINFNGDGSLNATLDANGQYTIDLSTTPIDWDGDPTTPGSSITVDMTRISQFAGSYQNINSTQNGAPLGSLSNIEFADDGRIVGVYANGVRSNLYQIPVALFANPNGLNDQSGTIFEITEDSGNPLLTIAGQSGAGDIRGSTIEASNVDVSQEFAGLIVSQRGYTLNSQVIQAIDEMTERLGQL